MQPTGHLVDPELKPALEFIPPIVLARETIAATRASFAAVVAAMPVCDGIAVQREERWVAGPAGAPEVRVLIYQPDGVSAPRPGVLQIHGGGYVFGAPEFNDVSNRLLSAELGCTVCSVDYRLAPEHTHPAPLEDCYAVLTWMHREAARLGIDVARVCVMGESAGGGLAAALALLARDRGGPAIAFQHLDAPMIDDRTCVDAEPHPYTGEFVWTAEHNRFGWAAMLGRAPGSPDVPAYAAPARARDLAGLPPAFISVGALDLFLEECLHYGRRLSRAGVPIEMHVYPGTFHGFSIAGEARTTRAALRDSREALRRAMFG